MTTERMDISRPTTTRAQVIANLSILKGTQSDSELVTQKNSQSLNLLPDQSSEVCSDNGHSGNVTAPVNAGKSIQYRNQKKCSKQDLLIARMKALSVKSGSTDWGVSSIQLHYWLASLMQSWLSFTIRLCMPCTKVCTWPYKSVWFVFRCGTVLLVYLRRLINEQSNSVCIGDYIHILKNRFISWSWQKCV